MDLEDDLLTVMKGHWIGEKGLVNRPFLRNIQNIRICMGKKTIVSVTYEMKGFQFKKKTAYLTQNVFYVSPVWSTGRFMAVLWVFM